MAASSLCSRSAVNLCSVRQFEGGRRNAACQYAPCRNDTKQQTQCMKNAGRNARRATANAEALSSCVTYGGGARNWGVVVPLQRQTEQKCLKTTCMAASKDGSEVVFEWKGNASEVLLTGSFLDWDRKVPLEKEGEGTFKLKYALAPGNYQYKFLVDGEWQHRDDVDTVADGNGGVNNQVVIEAPETGKPASKPGAKAAKAAAKAEPSSGGEEKSEPREGLPATPTPDELQAIAVKAPPPGEDSEPIQKTVAKVMGNGDGKKASDEKSESKPAAKKAESKPKESDSGAAKPAAKAAAKKAAATPKDTENGTPTADATPTPKAKPAAKAKAGKKAGKAPAKPLNELMQEDVLPKLTAELGKENVTDVELVWENNELRGCFVNGGVPYCFWAFFPDGKLEGSRGFSLTSHGYPPSTIEPFFVDEKATGMTADMMVFWIKKRLFAQKSALPKLN